MQLQLTVFPTDKRVCLLADKKLSPEEQKIAEEEANKLLEAETKKHQELMEKVGKVLEGRNDPPAPKFCTNCGAPVSGGKFCTNCGNPLN